MAGGAAFFIDASLFAPGFENPEDSPIAGKIGYSVSQLTMTRGSPTPLIGNGALASPKTPVMQMLGGISFNT